MKVLTYNIHTWENRDGHMNLEQIAQVIADSGASVVSLNEVLHPVYTRLGERQPLVELARMLGMHWAFGDSDRLVQRPSWWGPVGNAVLSRFPIVSAHNQYLPRLPGTQGRNLLVADLEMGPRRRFTVYSTHLDHAFEGTRLWQMRGVAERLRGNGHAPHVLMGDFNTHTPSKPDGHPLTPPVVRLLRGLGYVDAFAQAGRGSPVTFNIPLSIFRIDYIFVPQSLSPQLSVCYTLRTPETAVASDHLPLLAEFDWRP